MPSRSTTVVTATAAALVIALSGCSTGTTEPSGGAAAPSSSTSSPAAPAPAAESVSPEHSAADVAFIQGMLPHHRSALEMAELASTRAEDPEVRALAARVTAAQGPEIEQMTSWLQAWGEEVPEGSMGGDMEGMGTDVPGMMSPEQMGELADARGAAFDEMWLTGMVEHHEGAVEMARTQVDEGSNPEAVALASVIIDDQSAEIEEMRGLLAG